MKLIKSLSALKKEAVKIPVKRGSKGFVADCRGECGEYEVWLY